MKIFTSLLLLSSALFSSEFREQMGEGSPHWKFFTETEAFQKFESHFEEKKGLAESSEGHYLIPKVVHFIWLGPRPFPASSVENVRSWIALHPDWTFKFWTDSGRAPPCKGMVVMDANQFPFQFLKKEYALSKNWGEKSDILRYEILYREGGTYVDHDARCLKHFDGVHRGYDFYCGLETPHPLVAERNITAGIGLLGSQAKHPTVRKILSLIEEDWEDLAKKYPGSDPHSQTQLVMERTYMKCTEAIETELGEHSGRDIVFPAAYFFAKKGVTPIYSEHMFANSWAAGEKFDKSVQKQVDRSIAKIERARLKMFYLELGTVLFFALYWHFRRRRRKA